MGKVLVVDDDWDISANIQYSLSKAGYVVYLAEDAEKGIEKAEEYKPDLILMDVMLPNMQGDEAVRTLKGRPAFKNTPVVLFTGLLSSADEKDGVGRIVIDGVSYEALAKPFDLANLLDIVKKHVAPGRV